jgi:hypothetical protein
MANLFTHQPQRPSPYHHNGLTLGKGQISETSLKSDTSIWQTILHDVTGAQWTESQSGATNHGVPEPTTSHTDATYPAHPACTKGTST